MAWIKRNGKKYIVSRDGELRPAKIKNFKTTLILHETTEGSWVRKVEAIRDELTLTGKTKKSYSNSRMLVSKA